MVIDLKKKAEAMKDLALSIDSIYQLTVEQNADELELVEKVLSEPNDEYNTEEKVKVALIETDLAQRLRSRLGDALGK